MPGRGHRFTEKEDRQAGHIAASMRKRGYGAKAARSIGYATVNKHKGKRSRRSRRK